MIIEQRHSSAVVMYKCEPADVLDWMDETFGPESSSIWKHTWSGVDCMEIKFLSEQSLAWFLLKWT